MNNTILSIIGLCMMLLGQSAIAKSSGNACAESSMGSEKCINGYKMRCVRVFNKNSQSFKYLYFGVNTNGQSVDPNSPLYMKLFGYTPTSCKSSALKNDKMSLNTAGELHSNRFKHYRRAPAIIAAVVVW